MKSKLNFTRCESNAQGALEYLLILVAAIIVVAIVVIFISGFTSNANQGAEASQGTILDSFTNWGNMLGGNTQGTTPSAPTTCAELGEVGTLTIGGKTVFCDIDGKMWTPAFSTNISGNSNHSIVIAEVLSDCSGYAGFNNWRVPTLAEHQTFRLSLPEHCPINQNCISTPSWDSVLNYTYGNNSNYIWTNAIWVRYIIYNNNTYSPPIPVTAKARCIRN